MFPFRARVMTRNCTQGNIVRQLANHPPYEYLVFTLDGKLRVLFHDDLRLAADVARWLTTGKPWNGVERRKGRRRQGERRRDVQNRPEQLTSDRRVADRRQEDRRWIVEN